MENLSPNRNISYAVEWMSWCDDGDKDDYLFMFPFVI
jgi:hypothetical protein